MMWEHDGGWWVLMMVWMVLLWGLIAAAIVWFVTTVTRRSGEGVAGSSAPANRETPEEILDRRLASGEIDPAEYRRIKDELARR